MAKEKVDMKRKSIQIARPVLLENRESFNKTRERVEAIKNYKQQPV
jgi:hypothetical protein